MYVFTYKAIYEVIKSVKKGKSEKIKRASYNIHEFY